MWTCRKCSEPSDDEFDTCWNCGTSRTGVEDPDFEREEAPVMAGGRDVDCLRCGRALDHLGQAFPRGVALGRPG